MGHFIIQTVLFVNSVLGELVSKCEHFFPSEGFRFENEFFRPFDDDEIYEFESKKYCEQDYKLLYAPQCAACGDFVFGEVIKV